MPATAGRQVAVPHVPFVPSPVVSDFDLRNVECRPFHHHHQSEIDSCVLPEVDGVDLAPFFSRRIGIGCHSNELPDRHRLALSARTEASTAEAGVLGTAT
jgi:hypothetical protein